MRRDSRSGSSCAHTHIYIHTCTYTLNVLNKFFGPEQTGRCAKVVARVGVERVHTGVVHLIISKLVTARIHPCTSGHGRMCALNYLHGGWPLAKMDLEFAIKVHGAISPKHITTLLLKSGKAGIAKHKSALLTYTSCRVPRWFITVNHEFTIYCPRWMEPSPRLTLFLSILMKGRW